MIEVKVPTNVTEYKEKLFFGLTLRQTLYTVVALSICVPLYIYGKNFINEDVLSWVVIGIALPLMFLGYFTYNDLTAEKFIILWLKLEFGTQKRKYIEDSIFIEIRKEIIKSNRKSGRKARKLFFGKKKYTVPCLDNDYPTEEMYAGDGQVKKLEYND